MKEGLRNGADVSLKCVRLASRQSWRFFRKNSDLAAGDRGCVCHLSIDGRGAAAALGEAIGTILMKLEGMKAIPLGQGRDLALA